jgi:hypothetical protein
MAAQLNKNIRIGIIGAGPGGLGAAEALREKGYTNITVFEKRNRVGGQALSLQYNTPDHRKLIYELGSLQPVSSPNLYRLIKSYNLHIDKAVAKEDYGKHKALYLKIYSCVEQKCLVDFAKYKTGFPMSQIKPLAADMIKLLSLLIKYRKLSAIGYLHLPQDKFNELAIPYDTWIDQQHFALLDTPLKMLGVAGTMANPELKNELPAYIVLKFMYQCLKWPPTRLRYVNGSCRLIEEGYQELWNRVAKQHHVILNAAITGISRKNHQIEVTANGKTHVFDKLIVTCSLQQASHFLDVTEDERALFSKIRYNSGWRVAFLAKNLPHDGVYSLKEHYLGKTHGCLTTFHAEGEVGDGVWLYTSAISDNRNEPIEPLLKEAEKLLRDEFHGEVIEWITKVFWSEYIPHCAPDDVRQGIYHKLENLQGKNDTYFIGETFSGSMHATVVDYAYAKVKAVF